MKIVHHEDFISSFEYVFPPEFCPFMLSEMERLFEQGCGKNRQQAEETPRHHKDDLSTFMNLADTQLNKYNGIEAVSIFFKGLQNCFDEYSQKYSVLLDTTMRATHLRGQKTNPGSGYHLYHCEHSASDAANRAVVYTLYLNSLSAEEGGETEFLYQHKRFSPKENSIMLFPAAYTHSHKGNLV